ncbi:organic cation transporter-like protein isoform X2 [Achroia grisella]|uniref:organic cation transporter-like protein isoform X2 n=1 Tax=Achroia grisella TaxID=688607 RepID=UPI0027D21B10|nr:organic cation transporter-like protein isoform X2 [Achroia grisella]
MKIKDDKTVTADERKDVVVRITGSFGKYQFWICVLIFMNKFPVAFHQMAIIFLSPKTSYLCTDTNTNNTCPCSNPSYDNTVFTSTMVTEWDLICGKKWLTSFTQTLFQLGTLVGSIVFGMASDRFGRRTPLLVAVVLQVTMGIGAAFMPEYWTFTLVRFLIGASVGGTMVVGFVVVMEYVGTKYRDIVSALYQVPFNIGHMLLPVFSYFFRDYRTFQLSISIPTIALLCYFFFLSNTPRWLIAVKRTEDAIHTLERVARVNGRPTEHIRTEVENFQKAAENTQLKKGSLVDLVRTPNLRKNILAMSFNWLTCSYCFYGVSQYVGQLSGNIFLNVAASASVTLIGTLFSIPLLKLFGRRTLVIVFNFVCACCLLILPILGEGIGTVICASIGVVASFIVFVVVYLYCSELFPTVVRNAAVGFSSMMARVGSMIAPFVIGLGDVAVWLPPLGFAILPLIAGCTTFLLPETKNCQLMTTLEEGENFGKKPASDQNKSIHM